MIKPKGLKSGDKIAEVSLSWGGLGDDSLIPYRLYSVQLAVMIQYGLFHILI